MKDNLKFPGIYRGKVLDSADPEELGRIRCEVYPMLLSQRTARDLPGDLVGIATDLLPWAIPAMPLFAGAGDGYGSFVVPELNSFVYIFFEEGDIYQPVYFAEAATKTYGLPSERTTDYPYTKVWKSIGGTVITINDSEGKEEIKVLHPSGSYIQIDSDGKINVKGNVYVSGTITADDFISNAGTKYNTHIHPGDSGGITGAPK